MDKKGKTSVNNDLEAVMAEASAARQVRSMQCLLCSYVPPVDRPQGSRSNLPNRGTTLAGTSEPNMN
eukprot:4463672-Amphidinium_carterae.1